MNLPHHNPSSRQGLHENCVPDDKIFSSICSLKHPNRQTTWQGKKHTFPMYFLTLLGHIFTILLSYSSILYTCIEDPPVCVISMSVGGLLLLLLGIWSWSPHCCYTTTIWAAVVLWCCGVQDTRLLYMHATTSCPGHVGVHAAVATTQPHSEADPIFRGSRAADD